MTYYASKDELPFGLEMAFFLVTFIAAIHYNYGTDFKSYLRLYNEFSLYELNWHALVNKQLYKEPGWFLINYIFKPFGFCSLIVFLSIIQNLIYYLFVKKYVSKDWWVMGVFIYLFSNSLYLLNMSMMRQGLSVSLFVLSWILFDSSNKRLMAVSFALIFLASTIHSSAIILYPCLLISFMDKRIFPFYGIAVLFFFAFFFLNPNLINSFFLNFADIEDIERLLLKYKDSSTNLSYGIGFVFMMIPFSIMLYSLKKKDIFSEQELKIIAIALIAYLIIPFRQSIPMISRMAYYFTAFSISAIPIAYKKLPSPYGFLFTTAFVILTLFDYRSFFQSESYSKGYMHFHSIFEIIF